MLNNTKDQLYDIPYKNNNSEGLYDDPSDISQSDAVVQKKYTIQDENESSSVVTPDCYTVVNKSKNMRDKDNTCNENTNNRDCNINKTGSKSKTNTLSRAIRILTHILLVVLFVGLAATTYLLHEGKIYFFPYV